MSNMKRFPASLAVMGMLIYTLMGTRVLAAELENIGTFSFPTSGSSAAQEHFLLGVGYLHSFGWVQAQNEFKLAQQLEPDFAMAYWGETFTYNHPFIAEWDAESPAQVLNKLGATVEEQLAKAPTEIEKGFLRAAQAYAYTKGDVNAKRTAWMEAMRDVYNAFSDDREVNAFYAVSLLSAATAAPDQDSRDRMNMLAGSLALELFRENENHPGAAHYIIHAFDDPVHAPLALAAAKKYADIAPAVSHALHMPTHIFIQHGMWPEVSALNERSFQAAAALWKSGDRPNDLNHSSDWGQYGDLQLGDYERAVMWIDRAKKVAADNPNDARSAATIVTLESRYIIETESWQMRDLTPNTTPEELLSMGMAAANSANLRRANEVVARLEEMTTASPDDSNLKIITLEVAALTLQREATAQSQLSMAEAGDAMRQEAMEMLQKAVELADAQRPPNGAAVPLKPAHELYGEALLEAGQYAQAARMFEQSLQRTPNRPRSVLGLARTYAAVGDVETAAEHYRHLLSIYTNNRIREAREAEAFLDQL